MGSFSRSSHTELHRLRIGRCAHPSREELWVVCTRVCVRERERGGREMVKTDTVQSSSWFKATAPSVAATAAGVLNLGFA